MEKEKNNLMEKIVSLAKRRGFVFPGSDIYGGLQGFYDYGPLGVELKNNLKALWWKWMTKDHENIVGIDGAIITNPKVWEASGHLKSFVDPLVECKKCHHRFKADDIEGAKCPDCDGELTEPKIFNILVPTKLGIIEGEKIEAYLRGEACQTIYLDYKNVLSSTRLKVPFGICQIGKAFRNEVTPGNFLFRQREFEQWDLQWFCHPSEMEKWFEFWKQERMNWYKSIFTHPENLGFYQHEKLAHYARKAFDINYEASPIGKEMEGIHWRGDWDLSRHSEYSGEDLGYTDQETKEKFTPNIVETSGGVDRTFLFLLLDAYAEEGDRVILKLNPKLSPYKAAIFPLLANKPQLVEKARRVYDDLKQEFSIAWDDRGNIGKRYYSQDEIGTPFCVTIDFDTLENNTVTVRDRDTATQQRIAISELRDFIYQKIK
ncbi:MAG: Glycyl-tRNA synthetase [Candidatus Yanofskybacteria bacterium GW2011_GWF1_44_227]|uniref:Glycyl-tRNA synthetase n=1 Tax=Candidatus Yanofskybacteria bacterium GW2011_GWE2_40_11 TaxID=1619033 RepID=A0A0G0QUA3_9BACT|nr:MAG: Glycyl-tRNA synthetase [Candidatus Yanofskybacteria bacterium GW2011_GWE1_40_10]KKR40931.1 MAG: Glycyl-tRNA synthetase [Candidatus Yanofskybacteria bacterium GW2011_GWE2_40_11]KKT15396.1 MAG: Glycyl-tRNA synthetase [Candidatus Yanofskybacteria bacterium GW2011_GWF2_43_596]KKT52906.1 MAG: Glycyl-tRNA synthetase [Candidatus Yanofskybacteria bacterium GW2011_GWF1_44_227]